MIKVKLSPEWLSKRHAMRFKPIDFHATSCVVEMVLRDLNAKGMSIETRKSLRVGSDYPFRIRRGRQVVEIDGTVIWCKLQRMLDIGNGESQALYRSGIAFTRRLDEFSPVTLAAARSSADAESDAALGGSQLSNEHRAQERGAVVCPECRVPAVVGARRCGLCGTILPQR